MIPQQISPGAGKIPRFLTVGTFNTIFGMSVFAGLIALLDGRLGYVVILLIAHVIAVLTAFFLHRSFVWRVRGHILRDLGRFWSVYIAALAANLVALPFVVEIVGLSPVVAQAVILSVLTALTYVAHDRFSFYRRPRDNGTSEAINRNSDLAS